MKFAPVLSQKYDPASLSDYHLILAHEVVSDREYAEYYSNLGEEHTVILSICCPFLTIFVSLFHNCLVFL